MHQVESVPLLQTVCANPGTYVCYNHQLNSNHTQSSQRIQAILSVLRAVQFNSKCFRLGITPCFFVNFLGTGMTVEHLVTDEVEAGAMVQVMKRGSACACASERARARERVSTRRGVRKNGELDANMRQESRNVDSLSVEHTFADAGNARPQARVCLPPRSG